MRFLADESFDPLMIAVLRELGHNVAAVAELSPGSTDEVILAWGLREKRIILHHDLDFGTLIFRDNLPTYGVILVRISDAQRELRVARLQELLQRYDEEKLSGVITRLTPKTVKITPLSTATRNSRSTSERAARKREQGDGGARLMSEANSMDLKQPRYDEWKQFAALLDGEKVCREMGIRPTAWYAQQLRNFKKAGVWNLSLLELRLMLYLEANKAKYNGGVENRARVESLLAVIG